MSDILLVEDSRTQALTYRRLLEQNGHNVRPVEVVERDSESRDAFLRGARILAIDDSRTYLTQLSKKLTENGFQVTTATSGPEALRLLDEMSFHIAVVDVVMPEMDGFEVC